MTVEQRGRLGAISPGLMLGLGFVSMAASLSTDLYLPAFPAISETFDAAPSVVQLTLTALMVGIAIGQLFVGSLSDALGRRPTLIAGISLFTVCAFAAALSPSVEVLIAVRFLQGLGVAAGAVLARAVISDFSDPVHTARAFSILFMMIALGPAVASPLGAMLTEFGGWQAPLLVLGTLATGMLLTAIFAIPESLPPEKRQPFHAGVLAKNLLRLVRTPAFFGYATSFGAGYAAMMVYISSSAFITQGMFGLTPTGYSLTFAMTSIAFMGGAWAAGHLNPRIGGDKTLLLAQLLQLTAGAVALTLALTGQFTLPVYLPLVALLCLGAGMLMSTASALAIGQAVGIAGAGSALVGFSQFVFGATGSPLGGLLGTGTALPATAAITAFALIGLIAGRFANHHVAK